MAEDRQGVNYVTSEWAVSQTGHHLPRVMSEGIVYAISITLLQHLIIRGSKMDNTELFDVYKQK